MDPTKTEDLPAMLALAVSCLGHRPSADAGMNLHQLALELAMWRAQAETQRVRAERLEARLRPLEQAEDDADVCIETLERLSREWEETEHQRRMEEGQG